MAPRRARRRRANVEVTESSLIPSILEKLKELKKQEVHIGAQGNEKLAMIAGVLEYGSRKMKIPGRSFVGTGKKKATAAISKIVKKGVNDIANDIGDVHTLLVDIGNTGREKMLKHIDKIRTPPLNPIYARRKGSRKILVMEKHLRESITFVVVRK